MVDLNQVISNRFDELCEELKRWGDVLEALSAGGASNEPHRAEPQT